MSRNFAPFLRLKPAHWALWRFNVNLTLRELDARNAPVQFDEREEETEPGQTGLRRLGENPANRHRETKATAPFLDSTV